ncbi:activin receptor type-1 [Platysternon megacephalum]|uniref:Activin receptor type-1 n=1 Tax=Platysternon megacephalum TaxID=55544 RepID=A0A4D9ETC1_9SAUR|nr:activin receptor type-1 [Platysternon megacephalum]
MYKTVLYPVYIWPYFGERNVLVPCQMDDSQNKLLTPNLFRFPTKGLRPLDIKAYDYLAFLVFLIYTLLSRLSKINISMPHSSHIAFQCWNCISKCNFSQHLVDNFSSNTSNTRF